MNTTTASRRWSRLAATVVVLGVVLSTSLATPPVPAAAEPLPPTPALAPDRPDLSGKLPTTRRKELVGDFLGRGYDQRAEVDEPNRKLNIYEPPSRGGQLIKSTDTDLHDTAGTPKPYKGAKINTRLWMPSSDNVNSGAYQGISNIFDLPTVYLAKTSKHLYISGGWGSQDYLEDRGGRGDGTGHQNVVLEVPLDGSCAKRACANRVLTVPNYWQGTNGYASRAIAITAIATSTAVDGSTLLAVGMTDNGVRMYRVSEERGFELMNSFGGMATSPGEQTPVITLAFSPAPSTMLAVGAMSWGNTVANVDLNSNGSFTSSSYRPWTAHPGSTAFPIPSALAVGYNEQGQLVTAVGQGSGGVKIIDPTVTTDKFLAASELPGYVAGLTFVDRADGSGRAQDLVVARQEENDGHVLRYDGSSTLVPQPVGGSKSTSLDLNAMRLWFPGYRTGRFSVENSTEEHVTMQLETLPDSGQGCWFGPAFADGTAFPSAGVAVGPRTASSVSYTMGGLTAGADGLCGQGDRVGQWAGYLVTTPVRRPADATVSKIVLSAAGELTITSEGGSLVVDAVRSTQLAAHPLGQWRIRVGGPSQPTSKLAPVLTGKRLDPVSNSSGTGGPRGTPVPRPVYRFDIAPTRWELPAVPTGQSTRVSAVLPVLDIQGSTDKGITWSYLGRLVPNGAPKRTSTTVTLGKASFYWQNPSSGPQYTAFRVNNTEFSPRSNQVNLADLPAPPVGTTVSSVVICPTNSSSSCDDSATPAANGLDQEALKVQIYTKTDPDDEDQVLVKTSDPVYDQVYYRYDDGTLVTNLLPLDDEDQSTAVGPVAISPWIGAYTNGGRQTAPGRTAPPAVGGGFGYLSTESTDYIGLTGHVGGSTEVSGEINVAGADLAPSTKPGYTMVNGVYVSGCTGDFGPSDSTCRLAVPDVAAPALYLTKDPRTGTRLVGLQFRAEGRSSQSSLPLVQQAGKSEHTVAARPLSVNSQDATMADRTPFLPNDTVDLTLISHGYQVPVTAIQVGQ